MSGQIYFEDEHCQGSGYQGTVVLIHPDPSTYYYTVQSETDVNDTPTEVIVDKIMRKYRGAWEQLAEM